MASDSEWYLLIESHLSASQVKKRTRVLSTCRQMITVKLQEMKLLLKVSRRFLLCPPRNLYYEVVAARRPFNKLEEGRPHRRRSQEATALSLDISRGYRGLVAVFEPRI